MQEGWLERDGVRLHYVEWRGDGEAREPALLLLHGLSSNALVWRRVAGRLSGRRAIALDQRSHGASSRPPSGHGTVELVADAAHAIRELGLAEPLVAGHSWGAAIAMELAAAHPELASGVALVDGPAASLSRAMSWTEVAERMQPPLPTFQDLEEAVAEQRAYLGRAWADDLRDFVRAGLVRVEGGLAPTLTAPVRLEILRVLYALQPEELLGRIDGPVLVAMAEEPFPGAPPDVRDWRRRSAEEVRRRRPDAQVRWYGSLHDIPLFQPEQLAADLERTAIAAAWWSLAREAAALARQPGAAWSAPAQGPGGQWDARDLLAHVASTHSTMAGVVAASRPSGSGEPFEADRWNASQVRRRRERTPVELAEEMRSGAQKLHDVLMATDLDRPVATGPYAGQPVHEVMATMLRHQRGHLAEVRAAL